MLESCHVNLHLLDTNTDDDHLAPMGESKLRRVRLTQTQGTRDRPDLSLALVPLARISWRN